MPKKILVVSGFAPSLINFRFELLQLWVSRGYKVVACAPEHDVEVIEKLKEIGVRYISYPMQRHGMNLFSDLKILMALRRIYKHEQADLCFHYTIKPVIYGSLAARLAGVSSVYSMVTGLGYAFMGKGWKRSMVRLLVTWLYRIALKCNDSVFFQNPDDIKLFLDRKIVNKGKEVLVQGSGVNLEHFSVKPLPNKPYFLMIARLLKEKGVCEYIAAAKLVKQKYPDVQCSLAGWLEDNASITQQDLDKWVDEGAIIFLGKLEDVRPAIEASSVYVLPSYREGTPRTVLEAMAMGRAVITTDAPGCRETVVDGKNGLLVKVGSAEDLAEKMLILLQSAERVAQMGVNSLEMVKEKYDVHKVNAFMLEEMGCAEKDI